jgi:hypothetical protein
MENLIFEMFEISNDFKTTIKQRTENTINTGFLMRRFT